MELKELMQTSVEDLAVKQHEHLKTHVLDRLSTIQKLIKLEEYDSIELFTKYSPAGDGYGADNDFINFTWGDINTYEDAMDIGEVISRLSNLKSKT